MAQVLPPEELTVIVNTGDDLRCWGLHVSPDLDSVMYALAGKLDPGRGWGHAGDTFECLTRMRELGAQWWFQLGDRDLATHLRRTEMLAAGMLLSEATAELCRALTIGVKVLPMSDDSVETRVMTPDGNLSFQEFFVRDRFQPEVTGVEFRGAERARTAPGVLEAIARADAVVIAPSNPVTSIGPILAVPGVRETLANRTAPVAAVSPIVGGEAVSGPAGKLMRMQGWEVSPVGVAQAYRGLVDVVIADERDRALAARIEGENVRAGFAETLMKSDEDKVRLAQFALESVTATKGAAR
jgi:LPPG:FO 2-phospho-L-lactate transferase